MTAPLRAVDSVTVTLADAVAGFLATMERGPGEPWPEKAGTHRQYGYALARLCRDLGPDRDVTSVIRDDLAAWMTAVHGSSAPKTWNRARYAIRSAWNHFAAAGLVYRDAERWPPSWPVPGRSEPPARSRAIPRRALAVLLADRDAPLRERLLCWLLYDTSARASEILRLDLADVDQACQRAHVTRKGGRPGEVCWSETSADLMAQWLAGRTAGPLFPGRGGSHLTYRQASKLFAARTAELPGGPYTLHQLRHSKLTGMTEQGASQALLKAKSGHESDRALAIYNKVSTDALQEWERAQGQPQWLREALEAARLAAREETGEAQ